MILYSTWLQETDYRILVQSNNYIQRKLSHLRTKNLKINKISAI